MLYKKYHRNYVKQFKKAVKFRVYDAHLREVVKGYIASGGFICIEDDRGSIWDLVFSGGRINRDMKIKEEEDAL